MDILGKGGALRWEEKRKITEETHWCSEEDMQMAVVTEEGAGQGEIGVEIFNYFLKKLYCDVWVLKSLLIPVEIGVIKAD